MCERVFGARFILFLRTSAVIAWGLLCERLIHGTLQYLWNDPWINSTPTGVLEFLDVEQNICVKYVQVTANDCTWIQTEDGNYIFSD